MSSRQARYLLYTWAIIAIFLVIAHMANAHHLGPVEFEKLRVEQVIVCEKESDAMFFAKAEEELGDDWTIGAHQLKAIHLFEQGRCTVLQLQYVPHSTVYQWQSHQRQINGTFIKTIASILLVTSGKLDVYVITWDKAPPP